MQDYLDAPALCSRELADTHGVKLQAGTDILTAGTKDALADSRWLTPRRCYAASRQCALPPDLRHRPCRTWDS